MTAAEAVARARSALGQWCKYKLGAGGYNPASPHPWNSGGECDCSGYVAWVIGVSRHTDNPWYKEQNGGWIETSAVVRDALSDFGIFQKVEIPSAGDVIVYGDKGRSQGHIGVVVESGDIIHCSKGRFVRKGDAIGIDPPGLWLGRGGLYARCALVRHD